MTENSGVEEPTEETGGDGAFEEPELRGRYVEGNYGKTGRQPGRHADDEEGQYSEGDYGAAGSQGGLPEPLGEKAKESGRYVLRGRLWYGRNCGSPAEGRNRQGMTPHPRW